MARTVVSCWLRSVPVFLPTSLSLNSRAGSMSHVAVGSSFHPRACRTDRLMYIIRCGSFLELAGIVRSRWFQIFLRPGRFAGQLDTFLGNLLSDLGRGF